MPLFRALAKNMAPMTNADESPTNRLTLFWLNISLFIVSTLWYYQKMWQRTLHLLQRFLSMSQNKNILPFPFKIRDPCIGTTMAAWGIQIYTAKNTADLLQVDNFTGLLQLVNKLQQTCQFDQVATSLLKSGLSQLVVCRLGTHVKISQLVASLQTSRQQVWNKLLTTCSKLVDIIRLVTRLF